MSALSEHVSLMREFLGSGFRRTAAGCAIGLLVSAVLGYFMAKAAPEQVATVLDAFQDMVEQAGVIDPAGNISVFAMLRNNWRAMLVSVVDGFVPFAYLPLFSLFSNGMLLGIMAGYYQTQGMSMALYLAGILPHGMFELTALVLAISCGVSLCRNMCYMILGSHLKRPLVELLSDLLRVLLFLIMPLTVAAALIECYVTPLVMGLFM